MYKTSNPLKDILQHIFLQKFCLIHLLTTVKLFKKYANSLLIAIYFFSEMN